MDLHAVSDEAHLYLTTTGRRTGHPHTVELWFAVAQNCVFLSHEGRYTDWMKNLRHDASVEFEVGHLTFQGRAAFVARPEDRNRGQAALYRKYYGDASAEVIDDWFSESTVVEIRCIEASRREPLNRLTGP
jgi:deazaflavin-dependent oxidoreductase (nitroreductase family)